MLRVFIGLPRRLKKSQKIKAAARDSKNVPSHSGTIAFALLGVCLVAAFYFWVAGRAQAAKPRSVTISVGPWGRLETRRFLLQKPAELLPSAAETQPVPTRWHFPGRSREDVDKLLASWGVGNSHREAFMGHAQDMSGGTVLLPSAELVLNLDPAARDKLYAELEKSPLNISQQAPFTIQAANADIWLNGAGLSPKQITRLRQLTYRRAGAICFCDLDVAKTFLSPAEFSGLIKALYCTDTLRVRLLIKPGEPIQQLAEYWGKGGRTSEIKALFESVSTVPGGIEMDVTDLLPSLPRSWLGTYPDAPAPGFEAADCFYTSLNFFRRNPEVRFLQPAFREETFRQSYHPVPKAEQFGDIIVLADPSGNAQHACVYIAGDIVFTKNGVQRTHPWVLMRIEAVKAIYARDPGASQIVFRQRDTSMASHQ